MVQLYVKFHICIRNRWESPTQLNSHDVRFCASHWVMAIAYSIARLKLH